MRKKTISTSIINTVKLIFLAPTLLFSPSSNAILNASILKDGRAFIIGTVTVSDINKVTRPPAKSSYITFSKNGEDYRTFIPTVCDNNKDNSLRMLDDLLSSGVYISEKTSGTSQKRVVVINCIITAGRQKGWWHISERAFGSDTPVPSYCSVTASDKNIDFGPIKMGDRGAQKKTSFSFVCSKEVSGSLKAEGAINGIIRIGDASIQPTFSNGRSEIKFNTKSRLASVPLTLTVQDTGATIGEKSGSMIMTAEWD